MAYETLTPEQIEQRKRDAAALQASQQNAASTAGVNASATAGNLTPEQIAQRQRGADALAASQGVATSTAADQAAAYARYKSGGLIGEDVHGKQDAAALDASRGVATTALDNTSATQINNNTNSTANFAFNGRQTANRQDADNAVTQAQAYHDKIVADAHGGIPDIGRLIEAGDMISSAKRSADVADINAQSENGGVQRVDQQGVAPGIAGFFGGTKAQSNFTAGPVSTAGINNTGARMDALGASIANRPITQADAATSTAATSKAAALDQSVANVARTQSQNARTQQQGLASMLDASARGLGPSAAQAQLQTATDRNIKSAAALAASQHGVNPALAMRSAMDAAAGANQEAAGQSAILKAQEQQHAQESLGGVLSGVRTQDQGDRSQDLGAATTNAGYTQQTALANAGNEQQTNLANLASSVEQQKQKDVMQAQLLQQVQAGQITQIQAQQQMAQFNADLQARQEAARNGQTFANGQAQTQAIGTGIAAAGSMLAAAL